MKYVTVAEMQAVERESDSKGWTYAQMMEKAGTGLAQEVQSAYSHIETKAVLGLIGSGNNGGDTLVALAWLAGQGWQPRAYLMRPRPDDDPLIKALGEAGGEIATLEKDKKSARLNDWLKSSSVVLDGVLGTGFRLPLKAELAAPLGQAQKTLAELPGAHVVAVDCPSGVDCDSGEAASETIPAEMTITMAAVKAGLLRFPAASLMGELRLVGIGLEEAGFELEAWKTLHRSVVTRDDVRGVLPARPLDSHKGTFGTVLLAAGSVNFTGAALLAGKAAYRSGAGLVTLAVPAPLHAPLAGQFPEATWLLLPHELGVIAEGAADVLRQNLVRATSLLIGCGFGLEDTTAGFLSALLSGPKAARGPIGFVHPTQEASPQMGSLPPLVIDADGLKLLARIPNWPKALPSNSVLTPHPGEMAVLTGLSKDELLADRVASAERFAKEWGHVVVLKGAYTVIASPTGETAVIPVATPALARAGTGDVLAGLIAGLRAQGVNAFPAAWAGAWIHAQAGLRAADVLGGPTSILAGDVLDQIAGVLRDLHI